ncbi:MAG: oligosaccharide flippase family protein [Gemmatimonas sp.]
MTEPGAPRDVGRRSARSGAVQIGSQAVLLVMSLASGLIMARLLAPGDFGVLAMASTLTSFVATFRGFGFSMAVVQAREVGDDDLQRLFRIGMRYSLWLGVGMVAAAPALALLYDEPRLIAVIIAVSAGSIAMSMAELPEALAMRAMRFPALRRVEVGSLASGMAIGLTAAWLGAGYWALVLQNASTALVRAGWTWRLVAWRPRRRDVTKDSRSEAGPSVATTSILQFARRYAATNLVTFAAQNIDRVTVGIGSGTYAIGLYDLAYRWGHYPVWQLYPPLLNVAVAGLSRSRDDQRLYRHYWRTALLLILSAMLPALTFFAIESRATILTLLGRGWTDAVDVFRYVTIGGIALALSRHTRWLFLSEGRTTTQLRMSILQLIVTAGVVAIGAQWNMLGIAIAYAVARWLLLVPELALAFHGSPVTWTDYWRVVWRPLTASAAAGLVLWWSGQSLPAGDTQRLAVGALRYVAAYAFLWLTLPGGITALRELMGVARRMRGMSLSKQ